MYIIKIWLFYGLFSLLQKSVPVPEGAVKGDFNGDGKTEYAWVVKPKLNPNEDDCIGPCVTQIVFSNPHIKTISLKSSIGGTLTNWGDLNGDGKDEIGILPEWFTSCWRNYYSYTLKNGNWQYLVPPFSTHCNQWEANVKAMEKVQGKAGYVKVNYSAFEKDSIVVKSKLVKVK